MFVKSLYIENLLSHSDTTLTFEHLTCLRGANGSGKSTIVSALQALLCGTADCTDARGAGLDELIRAGEDKAVVSATLAEAGKDYDVRASITRKSGRSTSGASSDYWSSIGLRRDVLEILVNSKTFFGKGDAKAEARQKELLASIILPTSFEPEPWVWLAINKCGLTINRTQKPFDLIGAAYDAAFKERTAVNRSIKDWRDPEKPSGNVMPIADIRARLKERQDQRTATAVKRDGVLREYDRAVKHKAHLEFKIGTAEARLEVEQKRRAECQKGLLTKDTLKKHEKEAMHLEAAAKLDAEIQERSAQIEVLVRALSAVDKLVGDDDAVCPTCKQAIPDDVRLALREPIAKQFNDANAAQREAFEKRKAFGDPAGAQKAIDAHNIAEKQVKLVDSHIADIEKDLAELRKETAESAPVQPDTSALDAELADLDARIEKGNAALQAAVRAESEQKYYEQQIALKKGWDETQALLNKLCDYFGPKGVQAKLLDESIGPFQAKMNAVLAGWGFECRLSFDPYLFEVRFADKDRWFSLKTISASQRQMFAVAFQVALAKTTGNNFVVVDAADIFLDANRSQLYRNLMGAALDQVIVLQSDLRREIPKAENAVFYMLMLDASCDLPKTVVEKL